MAQVVLVARLVGSSVDEKVDEYAPGLTLDGLVGLTCHAGHGRHGDHGSA
jgi:hypothetical protein